MTKPLTIVVEVNFENEARSLCAEIHDIIKEISKDKALNFDGMFEELIGVCTTRTIESMEILNQIDFEPVAILHNLVWIAYALESNFGSYQPTHKIAPKVIKLAERFHLKSQNGTFQSHQKQAQSAIHDLSSRVDLLTSLHPFITQKINGTEVGKIIAKLIANMDDTQRLELLAQLPRYDDSSSKESR